MGKLRRNCSFFMYAMKTYPMHDHVEYGFYEDEDGSEIENQFSNVISRNITQLKCLRNQKLQTILAKPKAVAYRPKIQIEQGEKSATIGEDADARKVQENTRKEFERSFAEAKSARAKMELKVWADVSKERQRAEAERCERESRASIRFERGIFYTVDYGRKTRVTGGLFPIKLSCYVLDW